jgi:hypothetical protein
LRKRRFDQFGGIVKTPIMPILVYLHGAGRAGSRGLLSDAPVGFWFRGAVFPRRRVKVSKFQIEKFKGFRGLRDLMFSISESFLMWILMVRFRFWNSSFLDSVGMEFESDQCIILKFSRSNPSDFFTFDITTFRSVAVF